MEIPGCYRQTTQEGSLIVARDDLAELPAALWWGAGAPLVGARGRGGVEVLDLGPHGKGVARTYRRGGALRSIFSDRFAIPGRAARELAILVELARRGVAVVEPLAAVARRRGVLFELRLVTRLVEGALPLPAFIGRHPEHTRRAVRAAGEVVLAAFEAGLRHRDLHPDNLLAGLVDGAPVVRILDLDRASIGPALTVAGRDRMLLRMARYLDKHAAVQQVAVRAVDRLRFLAGMGLDRPQRRLELVRLGLAYERAVLRHRVSWGRIA